MKKKIDYEELTIQNQQYCQSIMKLYQEFTFIRAYDNWLLPQYIERFTQLFQIAFELGAHCYSANTYISLKEELKLRQNLLNALNESLKWVRDRRAEKIMTTLKSNDGRNILEQWPIKVDPYIMPLPIVLEAKQLGNVFGVKSDEPIGTIIASQFYSMPMFVPKQTNKELQKTCQQMLSETNQFVKNVQKKR